MRSLIILSPLLLAGCAGVSFKQLDASTLGAKTGAPEGAVYYLPKPYLLVARLPKAAPAAPAAGVAHIPPPPGAKPGAAVLPATYGGAAGGDDKEEKPKEAAKPDVGASDLSFGAATGDYIIKLIYLPDRSRPMSMSVTSGLFGTGQLKPTLQNGWMLTSFEASADNSKFADVLTAAASVLGSLKGGGGDEEGDAKGGMRGGTGNADEILKPGIYDFDFDEKTGRLSKLCAVSYFTDKGIAAGDCP